MASAPNPKDHVQFMQLALEQARQCAFRPGAFAVGAVIVSPSLQVVSTGYSDELPPNEQGNLHAEACAIIKLQTRLGHQAAQDLLQGASIYTTLEPCSVRASGKKPCADRIIEARFAHVYMGVREPDDYVQCEGVDKLAKAGIRVSEVKGLGDECLKVARGQA